MTQGGVFSLTCPPLFLIYNSPQTGPVLDDVMTCAWQESETAWPLVSLPDPWFVNFTPAVEDPSWSKQERMNVPTSGQPVPSSAGDVAPLGRSSGAAALSAGFHKIASSH